MTDKPNNNEAQGPTRRFFARPRECQFCVEKSTTIDYKQVEVLRRFISDDGRIRPRRQTGTCAKHQRALARAIKRARHIALLPFSGEVLR
ncbi:MAG: 30S ribosomal protein S18 [Anaerolineales bacterium]|nr:30S ribosomal protein S18 [Anaerolineales bacterium]